MPIADDVIRSLLAPTSPLMQQSDSLRKGLKKCDGYAVRIAVTEFASQRSPEEQHVLDGLCLYFQHMTATRTRNLEVAEDTGNRARENLRPILNDLRRLGNLIDGIATGWLRYRGYTEAFDLVDDVFGPRSPEASAFRSQVKLKRRSPWIWWLNFLNDEYQNVYYSKRGYDQPTDGKLPSRKDERKALEDRKKGNIEAASAD